MSEELEGVVRVYNRSHKMVTMLIYGTRVTIPARGSVETSARRAAVLLKEFPGTLTQDATYARQVYTDEDFDLVEKLDENSLRCCLKVLMGGGMADIRHAFDTQTEAERKSRK